MIVSKKFALLSLVIVLFIAISGCKSKDDNPTEVQTTSLVGTWVLTKITIPNGAASIIMTPEQAQISSTIIAKADGTYTATVINQGVTTNESGTYSSDGKQITFKLQDGTTRTTSYTMTGNKLVISEVIETPLSPQTPADLEFTKQ